MATAITLGKGKLSPWRFFAGTRLKTWQTSASIRRFSKHAARYVRELMARAGVKQVAAGQRWGTAHRKSLAKPRAGKKSIARAIKVLAILIAVAILVFTERANDPPPRRHQK